MKNQQKIKDYKLVTSTDPNVLGVKVTLLMGVGFQPHQKLMVIRGKLCQKTMYIQPMVLIEKE